MSHVSKLTKVKPANLNLMQFHITSASTVDGLVKTFLGPALSGKCLQLCAFQSLVVAGALAVAANNKGMNLNWLLIIIVRDHMDAQCKWQCAVPSSDSIQLSGTKPSHLRGGLGSPKDLGAWPHHSNLYQPLPIK